jgi:hypothetical protein
LNRACKGAPKISGWALRAGNPTTQAFRATRPEPARTAIQTLTPKPSHHFSAIVRQRWSGRPTSGVALLPNGPEHLQQAQATIGVLGDDEYGRLMRDGLMQVAERLY